MVDALLGEGRSARSVALGLGLSEDAVQRHARRHLATRRSAPQKAAKLPKPPETGGAALDELVRALRAQALAGNPAIVHQYRLALQAQSDVRHAAPPSRDLASELEWIALRTVMLAALEDHPEARLAIATALAAAGMG
jgi:hypothetical protein